MKDFLGNELVEGDKVVFTCGSHGHSLFNGIIVGFTPKCAKVMYDDRYGPRDCKPLLLDTPRLYKR
jgi:hypothetical protein